MHTEVKIVQKKHMQKRKPPKLLNISISTVVVCYDSEKYIDELAQNLINKLESYTDAFEVIFVDDGCMDNTYAKLEKLTDSDGRIKVIKMRTFFGEASAFDAALKVAQGDKIAYLTTRVRINPDGFLNLINKLDSGYDLVVGWRYPRRDSKLNQFISRIFNKFLKKITNLELHDINSGVVVTKKEVLENLPFYGDLNKFIPILAAYQGYKVTEEKIEQLPAKFRQSRYLNEYLQRFLDIITIFFLTKYSKKPLHFLGFLGVIFSIVGGFINGYLFIYRLFHFGPIAGRPLLLLGTLLFVIGIQLISIGLIGEMIIFTHAKKIKEYSIEKILD